MSQAESEHTPIPSRRDVLKGGGKAAVGALVGANAGTAEDAAVVAAAAARDEAWNAHAAACAACDRAGAAWSADAEATNRSCMQADRRLAATPARTLRGLVIKLRRLAKSIEGEQQLFYPDEFIEGLAADGERLLQGSAA